nr:ribonuclease P protein component [Pararhodospirillum oryzae]
MVGRLKQRADFLRVAGRRSKMATPGLVLQVAPQPKARDPKGRDPKAQDPKGRDPKGHDGGALPALRVGFTTSRKVGGAVERNRARRRLRAVVDMVLPTEARLGHDYVVIGRAATVTRPFDLLVADLRQALGRLGMRR